jgi:hypothetical protein
MRPRPELRHRQALPQRALRRDRVRLLAGLGVLAAALALAAGCGGAEARPLSWRDLTAELGPVRWPRQIGRSFRTADRFARFVATSDPRRRTPLPHLDFDHRRLVLAAVGPRSSTGYAVRIVRVVDRGGEVVVVVHERTPSLGDRTEARLTFPYRLISIPEQEKRVVVEWPGRS